MFLLYLLQAWQIVLVLNTTTFVQQLRQNVFRLTEATRRSTPLFLIRVLLWTLSGLFSSFRTLATVASVSTCILRQNGSCKIGGAWYSWRVVSVVKTHTLVYRCFGLFEKHGFGCVWAAVLQRVLQIAEDHEACHLCVFFPPLLLFRCGSALSERRLGKGFI